MKISLSKAQKENLTELRGKIAESLAAILKTNTALDRAEKQQATLTAEIDELERSAEPGDKEAVRALADKRVELDLVNRQLHDLPPPSPQQMDEINALRREADRAAEVAAEPAVTAYATTIAEKLRPYCISDAHALHLARQTQAAIAQAGASLRRFGNSSFTVALVKAQLAHIDSILGGEIAWSFDPKL